MSVNLLSIMNIEIQADLQGYLTFYAYLLLDKLK